MAILVDEHTRLLVQGITGREGTFHTQQAVAYGTKVVAGMTPGKGGTGVDGIPVFNTVHEAREKTGANASVIFVPPAFAADAIMEAADAGLPLVVAITEGIPTIDMIRVTEFLRGKPTRLIGPNCPGIISPGKCKIGIMPVNLFCSGPVGIISRSGTLAYEIGGELTAAGIGQSTVVGMGADPVVGTDLPELLDLFECDEQTEIVVVVGEVGGTQEERAAEFVREKMKKPVIAFIAGRTAPQGVRMGHAGAIASRGMGSAESKVRTLLEAGVQVAEHPGGVPGLVKNKLKIG